jgi:hypothetical protein
MSGNKEKAGKTQDKAAAQRDKVKGALAAAEEEAEAVMERGKKITSVDVERALRAMNGNWPTQCRPNVAPDLSNDGFVPGMCLGLAPDRSYAGCAIGKISKQCPSLTMLVTGWVKATLKDTDFKFGAVQVNYNYIAKKHIDMNNLGPSYICSLGKHTGGELWTADRGVLKCSKGQWKLFDGNTLHCTQPFKGERFSFILFTPDAYNRLFVSYAKEAQRLGFTAASSNKKDDPYFQQFRDLGKVEEKDFDKLMANRSSEAPPPLGNGSVAVECNGYAAGRGSGWVSFQGATRGVAKGQQEGHHQLEVTKSGVEIIHFAKNKVGIHVVELEAITKPKKAGAMEFKFGSSQTFNLYGNAAGLTEKETKRWSKWVAKLPTGRIVAVCITDTAMAKTRPLKEEVYDAMYKLGAPKSLRLIGYREPFAFVGWKGLKGKGVVGQDPKKQSKTLLRIETTVQLGTSNKDGTGLEFQEVKQDEVKLLGALSAEKTKQKKRAALSSASSASPQKKKKTNRKK